MCPCVAVIHVLDNRILPGQGHFSRSRHEDFKIGVNSQGKQASPAIDAERDLHGFTRT
jgi:hypothetical protein